MNVVWLGWLAAWMAAAPACEPARGGSPPAASPQTAGPAVAFAFKDEVSYQGRSLLQYRALELGDQPVQPLAGDFKPEAGARYGQVPVGPTPRTALAIVWFPKAPGGPVLWLDRNGDGRLTADERYGVAGSSMEIPVSIALEDKPGAKRIARTLVVRRSASGDGLRYAVRGYAKGTLDMDGAKHAALIVDANADGLLSTVGQDRVWIDLDQDGRLDPITEQFPLGRPVSKAGQVFVVSSDATASAVRARKRSGLTGTLQLDLATKTGRPPKKVVAELISDLGELVVVEQFGKPLAVPAGDYYCSSLNLELPDAEGNTWSYSFRSGVQATFPIQHGQRTQLGVLRKFVMEVSLPIAEGKVKPAETFEVTPRLVAGGLELSRCNVERGGLSRSAERGAEILMLTAQGKEISRGTSGFS